MATEINTHNINLTHKDNNNLKYEDIIDIELEKRKQREVIEIALQKPDNSWTVYDTKDPKVSVVFKKLKDSNAVTVRAVMTMKVGPNGFDLISKYGECGYDDIYNEEKRTQKMYTEKCITQLIDNNHQIVYCSGKSPFFMMAPRDITYITSRCEETNYVFNEIKYEKIVACLADSVKDDHPFNVPIKKGHVRATQTAAHIFSQTAEQQENGELRICTMFSIDLGGSIPKWIVNQFVPSQGMEVKKFETQWERVKEIVAERKKKNFKKDHEPLFK